MTEEITLAMATNHLEFHHEANHGSHSVSRDELQKLERPVLMMGCSQQDFRFSKICTDTPIQERVDTEERARHSDTIDKVGSQKMYSIVGSDIPDVETDNGNYIKRKNNPVQHEPSGASLLSQRHPMLTVSMKDSSCAYCL